MSNSNSLGIFNQKSKKFIESERDYFTSAVMQHKRYREESYFRSEEMSLCQLFVKADILYKCICELGELGLVEFIDEEKHFRLKFSQQMTYCGEMDGAIRFLEEQFKIMDIPVPDIYDEDIPLAPQYNEMMHLRIILQDVEAEVAQIADNYNNLLDKYQNLLETSAVLEKADEFFMDALMLAWSDSLTTTLLVDRSKVKSVRNAGLKLAYLTGTIPTETFFTFERVLWRVCRGNYYLQHADMRDTRVESLKKKFVFMIFFQGEAINERIRKICKGFQPTLYQCPESSHERLIMLEEMEGKIKDLQVILQQTDHHRRRILEAAAKNLPFWRVRVRKATAVYHIMNQMDSVQGDKYFVAKCWMPTTDIPLIQHTLYKAAVKVGSTVPPIIGRLPRGNRIPPTYHRLNRVLRGFQTLVDSYGVGIYKEVNPATYTIVSFPFLFAVMFGDLGHGMLIAIFAIWMVRKEKSLSRMKLKNEVWDIVFGGRYIILGMGLFSVYTGSIYNDIFSKSFKHFSSAWNIQYNISTVLSSRTLTLDPKINFRRSPYPYGIDPVWDASGEHAIITLNSFKMKLAIILGVMQMFFGLVLSAKNHIFFRNYIDLFGMCIPQMIFFSLFLYLVALIFMKWAWYSAENDPPYDTHCAPSLLIIFINMLLFKHNHNFPKGCTEFMFKNQFIFQRCLVFTAMLCIPVMLLSKPVYIMMKRRKRRFFRRKLKSTTYKFIQLPNQNGTAKGLVQIMPDEEGSSSSMYSSSTVEGDVIWMDESEHLELSEVFINQGIHTIECVLGAISHTASYLRLWALSLAHDQLSSVLWNMILRKGLRCKHWTGCFLLYLVFLFWSILTGTILVVMEGLSSFLHTLRLHWVEFQSKFYYGSGTPFQPFDFKKIIFIEPEDDVE